MVYLLENKIHDLDLVLAHSLFKQKCNGKNIVPPTSANILEVVRRSTDLKSEWANMLAHQLPALPDVEDFISRLESLINWIDDPSAGSSLEPLASASKSNSETLVAPQGIHYWGSSQPLETLRFAGSSRLLVEFDYHSKHRLVEPYSFRQSSTGKLLFYGWELSTGQIKAFNTAEITNIKITSTNFVPRFAVELTVDGLMSIPRMRHR